MSSVFISKEALAGWERVNLESFAAAAPPGAQRGDASELAQVRARAREEGTAAGYREGLARARAEAERLAALAASGAQSLEEGEAKAAEAVLDLALELARQMVRTELKVRREALLPVVREAMQLVPAGAPGPQLVLNPGDAELVRAHIGDEVTSGGFRIVEDHRIAPGGCRIVSPACEVDATLPTRWRRIVDALGRDHGWLDL